MITTIASSYEAAADLRPAEPHSAWRRAWQQLRNDCERGQHVRVEDLSAYLAEVPLEDQADCACDLIAEHMRLYSRAGEPLLEDYVAALGRQLPWLADSAPLPADLIEDEFVVRSTPPHGDYPRLANYLQRFPGRTDVHERLARRCLANQRYVKRRVLGAGACGVVYEAYDCLADRPVAVKEASRGDAAAQQRLVNEMELTSDMNHPGVVPAYDFGQTAESDFFVMGLITGHSLSERIGESHTLAPTLSASENRRQLRELVACVSQVCRAVAHAHERRILHRDLKPGNILVSLAGEAVIIDWGLARRWESPGAVAAAQEMAVIAGTPQYMAPEQIERQESTASDVFSLGATLYEVLTGRPPYHFSAESLPPNWQDTVRQARIMPPRRLVSGTPRQLDAICAKALARAPADRYATASELASALDDFLHAQDDVRRWWNPFGRLFATC